MGYVLSGEIALKNNHYYYYFRDIEVTDLDHPGILRAQICSAVTRAAFWKCCPFHDCSPVTFRLSPDHFPSYQFIRWTKAYLYS